MSTPCQPIKIWPFHSAPQEWQELMDQGGDEDWIAEVPEYIERCEYIPFIHNGGGQNALGTCSIEQKKLPDGRVLYVGTHA